MRARGMRSQAVEQIVGLMKLQYQFARTGRGWDEYAATRARVAARMGGAPPDMFPGTPDHPYWQFIRRLYFYDPAPTLRRLQVPTLALFGELDNNIVAEKNKAAWEAAFKAGGNRDYTLRIVPQADHLQLEARIGSSAEMMSLQRFVPAYFTTIQDWLATRIRGFGAPRQARSVPEVHQPDELDVRHFRQGVQHAVGERLIHRDRREGGAPREGDAGLVVAADIDPRTAEQRTHTADDPGHVAIPDHQHPPFRRDVDVVVVDPNHAAVLVAQHRAGHPGPTAGRLERDAHGGLEARLRRSGAARVPDAPRLGEEQRVHEAHRLDAHPREQPLHRRHQHRARGRLALPAVVDLDRRDRPVDERQRQAAEPARQVEQGAEPP